MFQIHRVREEQPLPLVLKVLRAKQVCLALLGTSVAVPGLTIREDINLERGMQTADMSMFQKFFVSKQKELGILGGGTGCAPCIHQCTWCTCLERRWSDNCLNLDRTKCSTAAADQFQMSFTELNNYATTAAWVPRTNMAAFFLLQVSSQMILPDFFCWRMASNTRIYLFYEADQLVKLTSIIYVINIRQLPRPISAQKSISAR